MPVNSVSVLPVIKLAAVLRFLADGSYQKGVGNDFNVGVAQSTFSKILKEVLNVLEKEICSEFIKFPESVQEKEEIKLSFYTKYGFPGVIGCVIASFFTALFIEVNVTTLSSNADKVIIVFGPPPVAFPSFLLCPNFFFIFNFKSDHTYRIYTKIYI